MQQLMSWLREFVMKKPYHLKIHFSPVRRVEREGRWHPGWCEVNSRGQPTYPHYTKAEAEAYAERLKRQAVFHEDYGAARVAAITLPGE